MWEVYKPARLAREAVASGRCTAERRERKLLADRLHGVGLPLMGSKISAVGAVGSGVSSRQRALPAPVAMGATCAPWARRSAIISIAQVVPISPRAALSTALRGLWSLHARPRDHEPAPRRARRDRDHYGVKSGSAPLKAFQTETISTSWAAWSTR